MGIAQQRKKRHAVKICVFGYKKRIVQKHGELFAERDFERFRIDYERDERLEDERSVKYEHDDKAVF